jgi:hypothetical protein
MSGTMALNATTMTIGVTSSQARLFLRLLTMDYPAIARPSS